MAEREPDQAPVEERTRGGGEHPDPDAPPSGVAPGETGVTHQEHGKGQFQDAYDAVPDDVAASGSIGGHVEDAPPERPAAEDGTPPAT